MVGIAFQRNTNYITVSLCSLLSTYGKFVVELVGGSKRPSETKQTC